MALDPGSSTTRVLFFWASLVKTYKKRLREFAQGKGLTNVCMEGIICIKVTSRMGQEILFALEMTRVFPKEEL